MEEEIKLILAEIINNPEISSKLDNDSCPISDIGLDSLAMISFIVKIEEELDVCIDFDNFNYEHLDSISTFARFLEQCKRA
jgi:acyl carrier protein